MFSCILEGNDRETNFIITEDIKTVSSLNTAVISLIRHANKVQREMRNIKPAIPKEITSMLNSTLRKAR